MAYLEKEIRDQIKKDVRAICKSNGIKMRVSSDSSGIWVSLLSERFIECDRLWIHSATLADWERDGHIRSSFDVLDEETRKTFLRRVDKKVFANTEIFEAVKQIYQIMNATNYDRSDVQSDYFDVGYYSYLYLHSA